jgi:hypothetical protein
MTDDIIGPLPEPEADSNEVSVELLSPSRGRVQGDVLQVSEERAHELVAAGLAKHI